MASVKKILISVAAIAATVGLNYYAPGLAQALGVSKFLVLAIGSVVIAAGVAGLTALFMPRQNAPSAADGKFNVRIAEPPRWLNAGLSNQGGGALFGEFDSAGNFWYIIVHSDSQLGNINYMVFDDIALTLDANGNVTNNEFCLNDKKEAYTGNGVKVPYYQLWTRTFTGDNPNPPRVAEFDAAFSGIWTPDHHLTGTTFTVVKIKAIDVENRYKVYRWRGAFGLGEPSVSIVGEWSFPYDPRTGQYAFTRNAVLIWAWFRTHRYGRNKPFESINWDRVAEQADICDQMVTGINGQHVRYQCGTAIVEQKERATAEAEIMVACDGQLVFDDDGKCWLRAGYYEQPTLRLTRNRDIIAMESIEAQSGESETQAVVVRYSEPDAKFTPQPSAVWFNPNYYDSQQTPKILTIDVLTCQDHNQAMRLAKAIGMRSQPLHKIAPTVGLRGLRARQERFVNLNYDNTFAGDYEIATPVEVQDVGLFCGFGMVPVLPDRWTLNPGEEKNKPVVTDAPVASNIPLPTGVIVSTSTPQIGIIFDPPIRDDIRYEFQYIREADLDTDQWIDMTVQMQQNAAYSGPVDYKYAYLIRWRSVSSGGRVTDWSPNRKVDAVEPTSDPIQSVMVTGSEGATMVQWRNPVSSNYGYAKGYRSLNDSFGDAVEVFGPIYGGLGQVQTYTENVPSGVYYYWVQAYTTDDRASTPTGPVQATVS